MHMRFFSRKLCTIGIIGKPNRAYLKLPPPLEPTATGLFNGHAREVLGVDYAPRGPSLPSGRTSRPPHAPDPRQGCFVLCTRAKFRARMRRVSDCHPKLEKFSSLFEGSFQQLFAIFFCECSIVWNAGVSPANSPAVACFE